MRTMMFSHGTTQKSIKIVEQKLKVQTSRQMVQEPACRQEIKYRPKAVLCQFALQFSQGYTDNTTVYVSKVWLYSSLIFERCSQK